MRKYLALAIIGVFALMPNLSWAQEQQEQSWIQEQPKQPVRYASKEVLDFSGSIGFSGNFSSDFVSTYFGFHPEFGHFPHKSLRVGYGPVFFHNMENPSGPDNKRIMWGIGIGFSIGYFFNTKSLAYPFIKINFDETIAGMSVADSSGCLFLFGLGPETGVTLTLGKVLINISAAYKVVLVEFSEVTTQTSHVVLFKVGLGFWAQKG